MPYRYELYTAGLLLVISAIVSFLLSSRSSDVVDKRINAWKSRAPVIMFAPTLRKRAVAAAALTALHLGREAVGGRPRSNM
jgi:hypothetical protein